MYKKQLQEVAHRSCFNMPSYTCIREGPDHAPRFKAIVNFNGDTFESPNYCSTLRQAEHSAAEAALDESGVYENLVQEIAQRVGSPLPQYTTFRSGSGHLPVFTGTVELAGIIFTGEPAKNKKQAEKYAALAAWLSLKLLAQQEVISPSESECNDEREQIRIARALQKYRSKEKLLMPNLHNASIPFQRKFMAPTPRPSSPQRPIPPTSKILPFFCQKADSRARPPLNTTLPQHQPSPEIRTTPRVFQRFHAAPYRQCRSPCQGIAPPVTIRTAVPVFSSPPAHLQPAQLAPPVCIRQVSTTCSSPLKKAPAAEAEVIGACEVDESTAVRCLKELEISDSSSDQGVRL
ncbi:hypothetical protein SASPL_120104 [Salvia splendens]|uniref:DRBM domain-containing protein n=2 Tax=Salvia splendens TaxID=180675 RepID=A0A8X8XSB6_SALSN|nr:double-stranded RNA-binding protein 2-like isoform X2 [Salvia splendens]KAG6417907.1 hypothetical protein SASPL_120104 [Salvia splendens]